MTEPRVIRSISAADFALISDEFAKNLHPKDAMIFEIHALRAERDALRKDAARLDWLESRSSFLVHQWQGGGYTLTLPQPPIDGVRPPPIGVAGDAFRQAIDAALAVQP